MTIYVPYSGKSTYQSTKVNGLLSLYHYHKFILRPMKTQIGYLKDFH